MEEKKKTFPERKHGPCSRALAFTHVLPLPFILNDVRGCKEERRIMVVLSVANELCAASYAPWPAKLVQ